MLALFRRHKSRGRAASERTVRSEAPEDRLLPITVGNKDAVLVKCLRLWQFNPGESDVGIWRLIIVEDFGYTEISASDASLKEVLKVAEGLE